MIPLLKRIFNEDSAEIKRLYRHVKNINDLEESISLLSDDELRNSVSFLKQKIAEGSNVLDLKEEAFAIMREASKRILNLRHYDVQLIGGLVLLEGGIAEMQTGEGKTLVATLPSFLRALEGKGVHVITANEYLAKRDYEQMGPLFEFLGLTVGLNISQIDEAEKYKAYEADITYGTGTEFGFDYLRDNMTSSMNEKVQRPHHFAIVDEVDSILIDEARTPLIIAGKSDIATELFYVTAEIVSDFEDGEQFEYFPETKQITLTDKGADDLEAAFGLDNLYSSEHSELLHNVMQALKAHIVMRKDVDYIVKDDDIVLVDQFTGRTMEGRTFSDGLHQAIEAKEGVSVKEENQTQASITVQNYFRMYKLLSGMTGSATPAKQEFFETYNLRVVTIPTNKPIMRVDKEPLIFKDYMSKVKKIVQEVVEKHRSGQPVLIGTTSIEQSEKLSSYLQEEKIPHQVLNAKTVEDEAKIISNAGQKGQVIISTNMAGRGTDIILGDGVKELGGLYVIGTELHESARIDMQLRGRSGRQGDPGCSQFVISVEDDIFNAYDSELKEKWKKRIKTNEDGLIISPNPVKFAKTVQETIESAHFSARGHLLKLDDVVNEQRKIIYQKRDNVLSKSNITDLLEDSLRNHTSSLAEKYCPQDTPWEDWHFDGLYEELKLVFGELQISQNELMEQERTLLEEKIKSMTDDFLLQLEKLQDNEHFHQQVKQIYLQTLDHSWISHMDVLQQMREGINIRNYGQEDPYRLYTKEAYVAFVEYIKELDARISKQLRYYIQHLETE